LDCLFEVVYNALSVVVYGTLVSQPSISMHRRLELLTAHKRPIDGVIAHFTR
jgi:hypothetical protein